MLIKSNKMLKQSEFKEDYEKEELEDDDYYSDDLD